MSFFMHRTAAERYARARPYVHPVVIDLVQRRLGLASPVERALDVACGAGQSANAALTLATTVVGVDPSLAMLTVAPRSAAVRLVAAVAEALPFAPATFDIVTVALGFHWFERSRFLAEAQRVLREGGWLVIYNNGFSGRMRENPAFEAWNRSTYLARYPTPPRNVAPVDDAEAAAGFRLIVHEHYTNDVTFTAETLVEYLMTQSNVIASLEEGTEHASTVHAWLLSEVTPLFPARRGTFLFGGPVWCLQRQHPA